MVCVWCVCVVQKQCKESECCFTMKGKPDPGGGNVNSVCKSRVPVGRVGWGGVQVCRSKEGYAYGVEAFSLHRAARLRHSWCENEP